MGYSGLAKQRAVTLQGKDDREFGTCAIARRFHASAEFAPEIGERIGWSASRFDWACGQECQRGNDPDFLVHSAAGEAEGHFSGPFSASPPAAYVVSQTALTIS